MLLHNTDMHDDELDLVFKALTTHFMLEDRE